MPPSTTPYGMSHKTGKTTTTTTRKHFYRWMNARAHAQGEREYTMVSHGRPERVYILPTGGLGWQMTPDRQFEAIGLEQPPLVVDIFFITLTVDRTKWMVVQWVTVTYFRQQLATDWG